MIHLKALPGSPRFGGSIQKIVDKACRETDIYIECGIDSILVENMNDIPYVQANHLKPETTATMSRVCAEIKKQLFDCDIPCGVQVLAGANEEAIAIAQACEFHYIRAEGFVFSHVADEGFTDAVAGPLLRYRKNIGAEDVLVLTDIKKKHSSHAITSDVSLVETAKAAEFFFSDGVILTGTATGDPANINELVELKNNVSLPML
ncbi:uncharacterized protein CBL_02825 [Carabus blaptoides fortunei]